MSDGAVRGLGFLGVRIAELGRFETTVSLYRDVLGVSTLRWEAGRLTWFRLGDGTELHVYGPDDTDHMVFGDDLISPHDAERSSG